VTPVVVDKMPPVAVVGGVERKRQAWQYQTLMVRPGQDIAAELNGILFMKRPR